MKKRLFKAGNIVCVLRFLLSMTMTAYAVDESNPALFAAVYNNDYAFNSAASLLMLTSQYGEANSASHRFLVGIRSRGESGANITLQSGYVNAIYTDPDTEFMAVRFYGNLVTVDEYGYLFDVNTSGLRVVIEPKGNLAPGEYESTLRSQAG